MVLGAIEQKFTLSWLVLCTFLSHFSGSNSTQPVASRCGTGTLAAVATDPWGFLWIHHDPPEVATDGETGICHDGSMVLVYMLTRLGVY